MDLSAKKMEGVDLRVSDREKQQESLKAEVINNCSLEGPFVPTVPSNHAGQLRVEPMWLYCQGYSYWETKELKTTSETRDPLGLEKIISGWESQSVGNKEQLALFKIIFEHFS